jgi:uncharacterized delta-60 repeat protein
MKKKFDSQSAFFNLRVLVGFFVVLAGVFLALFATNGGGLSLGSTTLGSVQIREPERPINPISPSGGVQEEWIAHYNGGYGFDIAYAIALDGSGNVYVTGSSAGPGPCNFVCNDYATIKYDNSGTQEWVARYNGPANDDDHAYTAIAVDASGNVYVTGSSIGTTWPDYDYATVKYDSTGQQQWVARYSGPGGDMDLGNAIAVDASGNVYVTGASVGSGTGFDYATVKYDSSGQEQWVARYNGPGNDDDEAYGISVDSSGNVYVTGYSVGSGSGYDYATIKYNASGTEEWVVRYNGPGNGFDLATAIAVDTSGNAYVTGFSDASGYDYATVKYDSSGQEQWVARYNGPANDEEEAQAIAVDALGNVYVTGYSVGLGTQEDYATIKYNASGTEEWVARYNGPANLNDHAEAIAVDASGNVYVTGWSAFGKVIGYDYATIKYDSSGREQWVIGYNGPGSGDDQAYAIAVDASGNVYVTGYSIGASGESDYTTIKYSQSTATPTPTVTPSPTTTPTPTPSPTATPRVTPTPRARPTPAPRPTPPR